MKYFLAIALLSILWTSSAVAIDIVPPATTPPLMSEYIDPAQFIVDIYNVALSLGGFLAFGAVVYGAILYSTSAGNPSGQSEAKEWITQALVGLTLLFGAFLVLQTVNPKLTTDIKIGTLVKPAYNPADNFQTCTDVPRCNWTPKSTNKSGCDGPYSTPCSDPKPFTNGCEYTSTASGTIQKCVPKTTTQ